MPGAKQGPVGFEVNAEKFSPIDPARREGIMDFFNRDNPFFPGHLGLRVVDVRQGYSRLEVDLRQELMQPAMVMHGGASFGMADTAVAVAIQSLYDPGTMILTIEMKINYLEPILEGTVVAEAYTVRSSKRSVYAEVDIWSGGKLAARATTTCMIRAPR